MNDAAEDEKAVFLKSFAVSRETVERLEHYAALLTHWNGIHNLVAESTLPHLWERHFLDSAQIFPHIPDGTRSLIDLGSGAGFPGLILAILGVPDVHLVESTGKKAEFLRLVAAELKLPVTVHQERAEKLKETGLKADVITARALKSLRELFVFSHRLMNPKACCLFLKGQKADAELTEASKYWTFRHEKITSLSDPSGCLLKIDALQSKRPHEPNPRRRT